MNKISLNKLPRTPLSKTSFLDRNCKRRLDQFFIYSHVITKQVIFTIGRALQTKYLESQIKSFNERPHKIRRDLWKPILAISGFSSYTSVIATNNIVRDKLLNYPKPDDYLKLRRKERMKDDMDQLEKSVCSLCFALNKIVYTKGYEWDASSNLIIHWESPELKEISKKVGLTWPKCVQHQKLLLKRGTIPLNQEFKVIQKPEEFREELRKTRYLKSRRGRIESQKKEEKQKLMERLASIPKLKEILEENARRKNQIKMIDSGNNKNIQNENNKNNKNNGNGNGNENINKK
ncbi:hypothetical protein Glove_2g8 [Diversispora epigaea]|uniref:Uncharacterized protein n=1 Tax=Diversispora epigaea TaxID=1348612 RepID=A0A397JPG0_9GLOM|nr:hypothetical protein Glove_2g8 [Diversispora epigaea]